MLIPTLNIYAIFIYFFQFNCIYSNNIKKKKLFLFCVDYIYYKKRKLKQHFCRIRLSIIFFAFAIEVMTNVDKIRLVKTVNDGSLNIVADIKERMNILFYCQTRNEKNAISLKEIV